MADQSFPVDFGAGVATAAGNLFFGDNGSANKNFIIGAAGAAIFNAANAGVVIAYLALAPIALSGSAADLTAGTLPDARLPTLIVPATVGNSTDVPIITFDDKGRITAATSTPIAISATQIVTGTLADAQLPDVIVGANISDATKTFDLTFDNKGRLTAVSSLAIAIDASQVVTGLGTAAFANASMFFQVANNLSETQPFDGHIVRQNIYVDANHAVADADYSPSPVDKFVTYTSLTVTRTINLPAASTLNGGQEIIIIDGTGNCSSTITITIYPDGSDTINGSNAPIVINTPRGYVRLVTNSSGGWHRDIISQYNLRDVTGKPAVTVVATANLTLSGEQTIDGQLTAGSLVLATAQSTGSQNGPWLTSSGAWVRPIWYISGSTTQAFQFITTLVRLGTTYKGTTWRMTTSGAVIIDTTATTWLVTTFAINSNTVTGTIPASITPAYIGDVTTSAGSLTTAIAVGAVTDTKASLATKPAVGVVATTNLSLTGEQTVDGVLTSTSLILLTAQSTPSQNGPWITAAGAWTRPTWYPSAGTTQAFQFITTLVRLGTTYQGSTWRITSSGAVTIDTTSTTWAVIPRALNASNVTGTLPAANLTPDTIVAQITFITSMADGSLVSTGIKTTKGMSRKAFTVTGWQISGDVSGSCVIDILRAAAATSPSFASMVGGGNKPTLSSAEEAVATVSGWTSTAVSANDLFKMQVVSSSSLHTITVNLYGTVS